MIVTTNKKHQHINNEKLDKFEYFLKNIQIGGNLEEYQKLDVDKILIVATHYHRCRENSSRLQKEGVGETYEIPAILDCDLPPNYSTESNLGIDKILNVKVGVPCVFRYNDIDNGIAKGMIATVTEVILKENHVDIISVKFGKDNKTVPLKRYSFPTTYLRVPDDPDSVLMVRQFPITLAFSITTHSCQGQTLSCAVGINLTTTFQWDIKANMFFVAVSRVRSPKQLFMNTHPVWWLDPHLNVGSLDCLLKLKKSLKRKDMPIKNELPIKIPKLTERTLNEILADKNKKKLYGGCLYDTNDVFEFVINKKYSL